MNMRGPDARERRLADLIGLTLNQRPDGTWAARSPWGTARVISGTNAGWRDFRRWAADIASGGLRF